MAYFDRRPSPRLAPRRMVQTGDLETLISATDQSARDQKRRSGTSVVIRREEKLVPGISQYVSADQNPTFSS